MMKFGIFDQNDWSGRPVARQYEERLALAELYEACGFYCYQMSEHHGTPLSTTPSPSVFLAALSQRTRTLRFGPLVYLLPAYNPMRLAEEIAMLDQLSDGRFQIGIGRGASAHELAYLGVNPDEALEMYAEALTVIRQGLTEGRLNHQGRYWRYDDVELSVRPVQRPHPPFWYAVASPESAVWPARNGVNVICGGLPEKVRLITDRYRAVQRELAADDGNLSDQPRKPADGAGSAGSEAILGIPRHIVVADTDEAALAMASRAWPMFHSHFYKLWRRYGTEPKNVRPPPTLDPMIATGMAAIGSPDTVRKALSAQVRDGGINSVSGIFSFGDLTFDEVSRSVRLFADEVMPALREAHDAERPRLSPGT